MTNEEKQTKQDLLVKINAIKSFQNVDDETIGLLLATAISSMIARFVEETGESFTQAALMSRDVVLRNYDEIIYDNRLQDEMEDDDFDDEDDDSDDSDNVRNL